MDEAERPRPKSDWGTREVIVVVGGTSLISGILIGLSGPPFFIAIGPGIVAGPTWGGVVFLGALLVGAISLVAGLITVGIGRGGRLFGSILLACLALAGGIFGGSALGRATGFADWAPGPTPGPMPSFPFATAAPVYRASGVVSLRLDVPGFTQSSLAAYEDGLFGQWCISDPSAMTLSSIETLEVGRIDGQIVRVDVRLTDPRGDFVRWSIAIPRVTITVADERGQVFDTWSGPGVVAESAASSGRLTFQDLSPDPAYHSGLLPATVRGEISWRCGTWRLGD